MRFSVKAIPEPCFFKAYEKVKNCTETEFGYFPDITNQPHATLFHFRSKYNIDEKIEELFIKIGRYFSPFKAKSHRFRGDFESSNDKTRTLFLEIEKNSNVESIQNRFYNECVYKKQVYKLSELEVTKRVHLTNCKKVALGKHFEILDFLMKNHQSVCEQDILFEKLECVIYDDKGIFKRKFKIDLQNDLIPINLNAQLSLL